MDLTNYGYDNKFYGDYIWPCTDIMISYMKNISHIFKNSRVLELGCGKAFASQYFSIYNPSTIIITDGLQKIIDSGPELNCPCQKKLLKYGDIVENLFDIILGCDILYFGIDYKNLIKTIKNSLAQFGTFYLFYVNRNKLILDDFTNELSLQSMNFIINDIEKPDIDILESDEFFKNNNTNMDTYHLILINHKIN